MNSEKNLALRIYKDGLRRKAAEQSSGIITNKDKDYAVAFYAELFANTRRTARIFCEGAHSAVWQDPEFEKAFLEMMTTPDITILILTEENLEDFSGFPSFLLNILRDRPANVEMRHLSQESKNIIHNRFRDDINFAVFDEEKYRFETDKRNFRAFGSFNDRVTVSELVSTFDEAFDKSEITGIPFDGAVSSTRPGLYHHATAPYIVSEPESYPEYSQSMQSSHAS